MTPSIVENIPMPQETILKPRLTFQLPFSFGRSERAGEEGSTYTEVGDGILLAWTRTGGLVAQDGVVWARQALVRLLHADCPLPPPVSRQPQGPPWVRGGAGRGHRRHLEQPVAP